MSGIKVDVQWSPSDENIFITHGTAISLHEIKNWEPTKQNAVKGNCLLQPEICYVRVE